MSPKRKTKKKAPLDATDKNGVLAVVALGASLETAARYFKREPLEIVEALTDDADFQRDFKQAQEQAEVFFLKQVKTAALDAKNWRAATWSLERLRPDRYGRIKANAISVEEIKALFARLRETLAAEFADEDERRKIEEKLDALLATLS
ncbi:MAG: hypothetical protein IKU86_06655 [Thermoguttaceae bacterium]|nr:hypothetical protein [Thermoguttaceae bacterium]